MKTTTSRRAPPERINPIALDWLRRHVPFRYVYIEYNQPRDLSRIPALHESEALDARQWLNANVPFEFTYRESLRELRTDLPSAPSHPLPRYAEAWKKHSPTVGRAVQLPPGYGDNTDTQDREPLPTGGGALTAAYQGGGHAMGRAGCKLPVFPGQWNAFIAAATIKGKPTPDEVKAKLAWAAMTMGAYWRLPGPAKIRLVKTSLEPLEFKHPVIPDCGLDPAEQALPPGPLLFMLLEVYVPADRGIATSEAWPVYPPEMGMTIFQVRDPYATSKEKSKNKNAALVLAGALGIGAVLLMRSTPKVGAY